MVMNRKSGHVAPDASLPVTAHLPFCTAGVKFELVTFAFDAVEQK